MIFSAAREIALAFGVPPLLLGLPGDNTRANFEEANRAFWRQTVIPLVARTQKSFAAWLRPAYGDFTLDYDVDRIDALASEREKEWTRLAGASFLTDDEKREAVGYGKLPRRGKEFDTVGLDIGNSELGDGSGDAGGEPGNNGGAWQNQPRVPAGNEDGGQWTAEGGGATNDVQTQDAVLSFDQSNPTFAAGGYSFGFLTAELPFFGGGRYCVYKFDFGSVIMPGPTNMLCPRMVPSDVVKNYPLLNDN